MKLWSRGLGKTELLVDCRYYEAKKDPDNENNVVIFGNITDPVNWELKITLEPEDIPGFMKIALHLCTINLVFKNIYRYVVYLFRRDQYRDPQYDNLETKVTTAYNQMMKGRRGTTRIRSIASGQ